MILIAALVVLGLLPAAAFAANPLTSSLPTELPVVNRTEFKSCVKGTNLSHSDGANYCGTYFAMKDVKMIEQLGRIEKMLETALEKYDKKVPPRRHNNKFVSNPATSGASANRGFFG